MGVFRDYDQAALDAQYNLRARVPEALQHFQRWAMESETVRRGQPCRLDLAYGATPPETLDFFPATRPQAPLLVFIHGGYWQALDKSDFSFIAPPFQEAGIAVAVVNYALAPQVGMDEIVRQCRAAVAWLWHRADDLGIDRNRLHVAGHSAGGHLTAMTLLAPWPAWEIAGNPIRGVCGVSGVYDLEPIQRCYLNAVLGLDDAAARRNSPVRLVPPAGSNLILALGSRETPEFHRQQAALAAAWCKAGCTIAEIELAGEDHFTAIDRLALRDSLLFRAVARQISEA